MMTSAGPTAGRCRKPGSVVGLCNSLSLSLSLSLIDGSGTDESLLVSSMLFSPEQQDPLAAVPSGDELNLDLLSLSFPCWKPWSRPEYQQPPRPSSQTPEDGDSGQQRSFQALESASGDALDRYCSMVAAIEPPSISPANCKNSAILSGSDHLVSHRVSPLLLPGLQTKGVKLDTEARLEKNPLNALKNAPSVQAEESVVGCLFTDPIWQGWDTSALSKPKFSIEREAELHKQAAALDLLGSSEDGDSGQQHSFQALESASEDALDRYCSMVADPIWQGWDTSALSKPKFSIEREAELHKQAAALDLLGSSEDCDSGQQRSFQALESASGDALDRYCSMVAAIEPPSCSPANSKNSAILSGSDHLVSHRVSPLLLPGLQTKGVKLDTEARLEKNPLNALKNAPSVQAEESVVGCLFTDPIWQGWDTSALSKPKFSIEREAELHKQAAAVNEATYTWEGRLPPRNFKNSVYSCKVFLGGVPWDITEVDLLNTFSVFGPLKVEWPGKDGKYPCCPPQGYVYLLFDWEKSVKTLLQACTQQRPQSDDYLEFYYKLPSRRKHSKVQVIPWRISDNNFMCCPSQRLSCIRTVFVGALHGMLNAEGLAHIMDELFGGVMYAGIDTDKHKYPMGSGRVMFRNQSSYLKAVTAAFVQIKTYKFSKKVQIDPYLDDSMCQICNSKPGPFFCRAQACFKYYCRSCWHWWHSQDVLSSHQPLMRNQKDQNHK
ncbi:cytoplasmic polyadenylation element-binding protein 1a isoform X2 [Puntigrus tetrazona]|uniref:cytoplasmic polyadenylation element-binding protein 1a isoform X2 n=1 Tax=Puntigrus tetrazona TaxID=1606681 RepID=UPI001C8A952F|nr:cytoplasmic polyadenylation element-binding protein 1a isoform X2 [Puntigrus tetrazona]